MRISSIRVLIDMTYIYKLVKCQVDVKISFSSTDLEEKSIRLNSKDV